MEFMLFMPPPPHGPNPPPKPLRIQQFDESFCEVIKLDAVKSRINWLLRKYRIANEIEVNDIICEAYSRATKTLQADQDIFNVQGWLRTTSHNIIREKFRAKEKQKKLTETLIPECEGGMFFDKNYISSNIYEHPQISQLWDRIKLLPPLECKIITLQAQGHSMKQIATQLIQDGDYQNHPNIVANITQRASRARRQLRESMLVPHSG
jgi:DNA-directed RNA polymerase specialized sigma24 family protein